MEDGKIKGTLMKENEITQREKTAGSRIFRNGNTWRQRVEEF